MAPYPARLIELAQGYDLLEVVLVLASPEFFEQLVEPCFQEPFVDARDFGMEPEALRLCYRLHLLIKAHSIDGEGEGNMVMASGL